MVDLRALTEDLRAEYESLDAIVSRLDENGWARPTPAEPWAVKDQIAHLAFYEELATLALVARDAFEERLREMAADPERFAAAPRVRVRALAGDFVLDWWRAARAATLEAVTRVDPDERIPWFGPALKPATFVSARVMETWAHGQDVADGLGAERAPTDRLYHVAHLSVAARANSYMVRGLSVPGVPVTVELVAPSGAIWRWHEGSEHKVSGPAVDFCLVATQRRHVDDTDLYVQGALAEEWMEIAQAFAGPPGRGRPPGAFARRR